MHKINNENSSENWAEGINIFHSFYERLYKRTVLEVIFLLSWAKDTNTFHRFCESLYKRTVLEVKLRGILLKLRK